MTVKEVRVSHFPRRHGKPTGSKVAVIMKAFKELIKMRRMVHTITPDQQGLFKSQPSAEDARTPSVAGEVTVQRDVAGRKREKNPSFASLRIGLLSYFLRK